METESKIVTLFEFTQRGYEETQQQLEKLIDTQKSWCLSKALCRRF